MDVLREILTWSEQRPIWQRDAIRRLFVQGILEPIDFDDLYALLRSTHGIHDPRSPEPRPLTADMIPADPAGAAPISLLALGNLVKVNAVAPDQRLVFESTGLNVVYGDNGSGKSGYIRVLKRACRARDREPILANAFAPPAPPLRASAVLEIQRDEDTHSVEWRDGDTAPDFLSQIAVFDHRCARIYVDEEREAQYLPYGLDILPALARVCGELRSRTMRELDACRHNPAEFADLHGPTAVGLLITSLSALTDVPEIERLAFLSEEEKTRAAALGRILAETDPAARARTLSALRSRVERIRMALVPITAAASEPALDSARRIDSDWRTAAEAAAMAARDLSADPSVLPGTGGTLWQALFDAAERFSLEEAYRGRPFPFVEEAARCLLCQQELTDGAARLERFARFVKEAANDARDRAVAARTSAIEALSAVTDPRSLGDPELLSEIAAYDLARSRKLDVFLQSLSTRIRTIRSRYETGHWGDIPSLSDDPSPDLMQLESRLTEEIDALARLALEGERTTLSAEYSELTSRLRLATRRVSVLAALERLRLAHYLQQCIGSLDTAPISRMAADLHHRAVSEELAAALNEEFGLLGLRAVSVELGQRTERGRPLQYLRFTLRPTNDLQLSSVLSEGEQRAIALAAFLAEVRTAAPASSLVLDDPVSSLDHLHRERVATRLTDEARSRQLIIFTHDVQFLLQLREQAARQGVPFSASRLRRQGTVAGYTSPHLPFLAMSTKDRLRTLRTERDQIAAIFDSDDMENYGRAVKNFYENLRETWERAVEEVLLRKVVQRFDRAVGTLRLREVVVDDDDHRTIFFAMANCSRFTHDAAAEAPPALPTPRELLRDIEECESWRARTESRAQSTREIRMALEEPPELA